MKNFSPLFCCLFIMFVFIGTSCGSVKQKIGGCIGPFKKSSQAPAQVDHLQQTHNNQMNFESSKKEMDALTTCFNKLENGLGAPPKRSYETFFRNIDSNNFNCQRIPLVMPPLDINISNCESAIKKSPQENYPQLQKQLTQKYIPAQQQMIQIFKDAENYFKQENYKDDQCSQGKIFVTKIQQSYDNYLAAKKEFEIPFRKAKRSMDIESLSRLEAKEGKGFYWHLLNMQIPAEEMLDIMTQLEEPQAKNRYIATFDKFEIEYLKLEDYVTKNREKIQKVPMMSTINMSAGEFYNYTKILARRLEENNNNYSDQVERSIDTYQRLLINVNIYANMRSYYDKQANE